MGRRQQDDPARLSSLPGIDRETAYIARDTYRDDADWRGAHPRVPALHQVALEVIGISTVQMQTIIDRNRKYQEKKI